MRRVKIEEMSFWDCIEMIIKRVIVILFLIAFGVILLKYVLENSITDIIASVKTFFIVELSISSLFDVTIPLFCGILWISILAVIVYKIIVSIRIIYGVIFNTLVKCIDVDTGEVAYTYRSKLQSNSYYIPISEDGDDNDEATEEEQVQK